MLLAPRPRWIAAGSTPARAAVAVLVAWAAGLAAAAVAALFGHPAPVVALVSAIVGSGELVLLVRQQRRRAGAHALPAPAGSWALVAGHAVVGALLGAALTPWLGPAA